MTPGWARGTLRRRPLCRQQQPQGVEVEEVEVGVVKRVEAHVLVAQLRHTARRRS